MDFNIFKGSLKLEEFKTFLSEKMKLTEDQIKEMSGCGGKCIRDYAKRLEAKLPLQYKILADKVEEMESSGKVSKPVAALGVRGKKIFDDLATAKAEAHAYIDTLEDFKQILVAIK